MSIRTAAPLWVALASLLVGQARADHAGDFSTLKEKVANRIRNLVEQRRSVASIVVGVAVDGKILWEEGFGWADRERRIPADPHTMYSLASVSKPVTATALMVLVSRNHIDLDKPINAYLGSAPLRARIGSADAATVRRVASHTAGLPIHFQFFSTSGPDRIPPREETIRRYGNIVFEPGTVFEYSNAGYGVLDHVIARVSKRAFAEFLRSEVFLPLGMIRSSLGVGPRLEEYQAIRYDRSGEPIPFYETDGAGASAVYSSVHDMLRFGLFFVKSPLPDQRRILSDERIDEMHRVVPVAGIKPEKGGYAIGWGIATHKNGLVEVGHAGGMPGVGTSLILVPERKMVVAVLANSSSPAAYSIAHQIRDGLMPKPTAAPASERRDREEKKPAPTGNPPKAEKRSPTSLLVGEWKGTISTYSADLPLAAVVKESGDVHVRIDGKLWTLLNNVKFADGWLRGRFMGDLSDGDAARHPYDLELALRQVTPDRFAGQVTAISRAGVLLGSGLSFWTDLRRESESGEKE